ncbi:MAG: hypothetical protein GVY07_00080, partial [Bacteroidetes bacterium]|nr:hypothetical protein [Bacteroidota bacterium]
MQIHSNSQNQVLKLILTVIISLFYVLGYSQSCATFDWSDYKTGPNGLGQWPSTSLNNTYINDGVNFEYLVDPPPGGLATFLPVVGPLYEGGLGSVDDQLILAASAGNIDGNSIVVEIDMGVPGIGLENVGLTLFDIDGGNNGSTVMYGEQVTITGEISGTTVSPTITGTSIHTISGNTVTADETDSPNTGTNSGDGNVDVEFNSAVDKVRIEFTLAPGADFVSGSEPGFSVYNLDYCPPDISIELTDGSCWRTMTSPVAGETYQDFFARFRTNNTDYGGLWTQGATGARFTGGDPNVFTLNSDGSDWVAVGDLTQSIPPGTGFLISVFDEDDFNNPSSSGFNKIATIDGSDVENSSAVTVDLGTPSGTTAS